MAKSSKSKKKANPTFNLKLFIIALALFFVGFIFVIIAVATSAKGVKIAFGILGGIGLVASLSLGVLAVPLRVMEDIVYKEHVLQLRKGERVIGEIPYENIATVEHEWIDDCRDTSWDCLAITVFKAKDRKTHWKYTPRYFKPFKLRNGDCDFVIPDRMSDTLPSIEREIKRRIEAARGQKTKSIPKGLSD